MVENDGHRDALFSALPVLPLYLSNYIMPVGQLALAPSKSLHIHTMANFVNMPAPLLGKVYRLLGYRAAMTVATSVCQSWRVAADEYPFDEEEEVVLHDEDSALRCVSSRTALNAPPCMLLPAHSGMSVHRWLDSPSNPGRRLLRVRTNSQGLLDNLLEKQGDTPKLRSLVVEMPQGLEAARVSHLTDLRTLHLDVVPFYTIPRIAALTRLKDLKLSCYGADPGQLVHLSCLARLESLNLHHTLGVSDISFLSCLTRMSSLGLDRTEFPGDQLVHLVGLTCLQELDLANGTGLSDISPLSCLECLSVLILSDTAFPPDQSVHLSELTRLEILYLGNNAQLSDASSLSRLERLTDLELSGTSVASDQLVHLSTFLPTIRFLDIGSTLVVDLMSLTVCREIEQLRVSYTQVADIGPLANCTKLDMLLCNDTLVSDLGPLSNCKKLSFIDGDNTPIQDLTALASCTVLEHVSFNHTSVSSLTPLASCPNLQHLSLDNTQVANLDALQTGINLQHLSLDSTPVAHLGPLANCTKLEHLSLRNTLVTRLGADILRLPRLTRVDIR